MEQFRLECRGGCWGGYIGVGWRPAICGTLNQTGQDDTEASTFSSEEEAWEALDVYSGDTPNDVEFRVVRFS